MTDVNRQDDDAKNAQRPIQLKTVMLFSTGLLCFGASLASPAWEHLVTGLPSHLPADVLRGAGIATILVLVIGGRGRGAFDTEPHHGRSVVFMLLTGLFILAMRLWNEGSAFNPSLAGMLFIFVLFVPHSAFQGNAPPAYHRAKAAADGLALRVLGFFAAMAWMGDASGRLSIALPDAIVLGGLLYFSFQSGAMWWLRSGAVMTDTAD